MSRENRETLDAYNAKVQQYVDGTGGVTDGYLQEVIDSVLVGLPKTAAILEIGSAFGREAKYLQSKGYHPDLTDGSTGFVQYLNDHGMQTSLLDVVNQPIEKKYDVVFAFAVLLHFTDEDFTKAVTNVRDALKQNGVFVFSLLRGEGERWTEDKLDVPRYFRYWQEDGLRGRLRDLGMAVTDVRDGLEGRWMFVTTVGGQS